MRAVFLFAPESRQHILESEVGGKILYARKSHIYSVDDPRGDGLAPRSGGTGITKMRSCEG